jgi:hypothetical protein
MTPQKNTDGTIPEKDAPSTTPDRIPAAVQKLMNSTPRKKWSKIRAFLIESEEEGELVEMLPEVNQAMKACLPKLVGRVRKKEITGDDLDLGYQQLHDAIHGVRQALYALLVLAGFKDPELKDPKPEEPAPADALPAAEATSTGRVAPAPPGRFALAERSGKL